MRFSFGASIGDFSLRNQGIDLYSPRIRVPAQNREAAINLLQQERARPIAGERQARKRKQQVSLFPEGIGESFPAADQESQFAHTPHSLLTKPLGELFRCPLTSATIQEDLVAAAQFLQQTPFGRGETARGSSLRPSARSGSMRGLNLFPYELGKMRDAFHIVRLQTAQVIIFCFALRDQADTHLL